MIAYLFWHRAYPTTTVKQYEEALMRFQQRLGQQQPPGFGGSASFRVAALPWLDFSKVKSARYRPWFAPLPCCMAAIFMGRPKRSMNPRAAVTSYPSIANEASLGS